MNAVEVFEEQRPRLFGIAYRMLGSVMDAEDVVQDVFLSWRQAASGSRVESPQAYLTTLVSRRCLDILRSARVRRETYVGPWLPEPLLTDRVGDPLEATALADSLSTAFLLLLERLSPRERAAFLLREVFGYEYDEIARIVETTESASRQLVARARRHLAEGRRRYDASPEQQSRLLNEFVQAATRGELSGLISLLAEDATLIADGGGRVTAARQPIAGAERVARFIFGVLEKQPLEYRVELRTLNGQPGVVAYIGDQPIAAMTLGVAEGRVQEVFLVVNPDKLARIAPASGQPVA